MEQNTKHTAWLKKIIQLLIVMSFALTMLNLSVQAAGPGTLPLSETIDLSVNVDSFMDIECGLFTLDLEVPVTSDVLQPSPGKHYGEAICAFTYTYNDPSTDFAVKIGKDHTHDMTFFTDDAVTIANIDNSGGTATDYAIDSSGNSNAQEELGYRIESVVVPSGDISVQTDGTFGFSATTCGGGTDECFFDISSTRDTVIAGDNTSGNAICMKATDCSFDLKIAINITNSTAPGFYGTDVVATGGYDETYEVYTELITTP